MQTPNSNGPASSAAGMADESRGTAAGAMDSAAATLRDSAASLPGGEKVAGAARAAADAVGTAASYVRDNDARSMLADAQKLVKNNPGVALLTAAAIGFFVARIFSRD